MSLLSICQDTADVIGLTRPVAIITGPDQLARQMLGFCKETLEELALMDWPVLASMFTITTAANVEAYSLPTDFQREIGDSVYEATRYAQVRGGLTPGDWARQRNVFPSSGRFRFRIFGYETGPGNFFNPQIHLTPTPTDIQNFVLEYQTKYCVVQTDGTRQKTFNADDDITLVAEDLMKKGLKWRMRRAKGLDYSEEFDDYEMARTSRLAQAMQFGSMPVAYRSPFGDDEAMLTNGYVPETGFGV